MNHNFQWDAQAALGFVVSQTSHIEQQVYEIVYPDIQYPALIPVDTSANPFAKTVTYYSSDRIGRAEWINGNADDVPLATTEMTKFETAVHTAGIGYAYGWEEINHAQSLGLNLPDMGARAARRAYEEMIDRVLMFGDAAKGFSGLTNHAAVTPVAAPTGDWGGTGSDEVSILADFNSGIILTGANTLYTNYADTVLLPFPKLEFLASTRLGDTAMTLLEFLRMNNVYTAVTGQQITIRGVRGLETAGTGGVARMITYRRNPEVLKAHIPMPHRFLTPYQAGPLRIEVPGVFRFGGLDIRLPNQVAYHDGI